MRDEAAERIPLTIADFDRTAGTITLVMMVVGASSPKLAQLEPNEHFYAVIGPLGHPSQIDDYSAVVMVAGGVGTAPIFPIAPFQERGTRVITIQGARLRELLFWTDRLRSVSDELIVTTDDGSASRKGLVTEPLRSQLEADRERQIGCVYAIGPTPMMRFCERLLSRLGSIRSSASTRSWSTAPVCAADAGSRWAARRVSRASTVPSSTDISSIGIPCCPGRRRITRRNSVPFSGFLSRRLPRMINKRSPRAGRIPMPEQPPEQRVNNFGEVPLGYSPAQAQQEAARCLGCKQAACRAGCPVGVDIPGFVGLIADGQSHGSGGSIKQTNCLPAVCGRVCPQESQCEALCVLARRGESVAIGRLERFAADFERESGQLHLPQLPPPTGKRVAVIGAGPAGLTVAGDLLLQGHEVTVFEAFHKAGGVLVYGIPEFRLPKRIVEQEVEYLRRLGVKIELNQVVGQSLTVSDLLGDERFDAVFLGVGAGLPVVMGIPGENLVGVYLANEYLTRVNLMRAYAFPAVDTPVVRGNT